MNHVLYLKIHSRPKFARLRFFFLQKVEFTVKNLEFVDVLAVLDFEIPCSRPGTPDFHPRPIQ